MRKVAFIFNALLVMGLALVGCTNQYSPVEPLTEDIGSSPSFNPVTKASSEFQFLYEFGGYGSSDGQLLGPYGIALDAEGNVYVAELIGNRVQKFTSTGSFISKWGSAGAGEGQFANPRNIAVDKSGNVYVTDPGNHRIQKFNSSGDYLTEWGRNDFALMLGTLDDGALNYPMGIAVDDAGNVYVTDTGFDDFTAGFNRIQKFDSNGMFLLKWGSQGTGEGQFSTPPGIAVDGDGFVYVADGDNNRVQKFTSEGAFVTQWGSQGTGAGQFDAPYGIAVKGNEAVYVVEHYNHRVQQFTGDGTPVFMWGSNGTGQGQFKYPYCAAVDGSGRVYIADSENHRIQVFGYVEVPKVPDLPEELMVEIDIKPGSDNNPINLKNEHQVITVAILTTEAFDALAVDHTTVLFENAKETHVNKKSDQPHRTEDDVDKDGDKDLVFHFRVGDTQLTKSSTEGTLTGVTFDGQNIKGTDVLIGKVHGKK